MPTIYDVALSPFSQKVKIALQEKNISYDCVTPDMIAGDPALLRANPRAEVPALLDEGTAVFDSTVILGYIEDRWPDPPLLPAGAADRARVRMIEEVCDTHLEAVTFGMTEVIAFKRANGERGKAMLEAGARDVSLLLGWLERQLGERDWFNDECFGYGDLAAFPFINITMLYKVGPKPGSGLADWLARARERQSVAKVLEEAKAAMGTFKSIVAEVQSGRHPRQLRDHRLEWFMRAGAADLVVEGLNSGALTLPRLPQ
jgi:glutathione S-transferase/RNA polymerase-associated protein